MNSHLLIALLLLLLPLGWLSNQQADAFRLRLIRSLARANKFDKENCGRTSRASKPSGTQVACSNRTSSSGRFLRKETSKLAEEDKEAHMQPLYAGEFPSHATLLCRSSKFATSYRKCSGVIVNPDLVLTKVDCIKDKYTCMVYAGQTNNLENDLKQRETVVGYCILPNYALAADGTADNDVALALLRAPFELSVNVQPACVDVNREMEHTVACTTLIDFGKLTSDADYTPDLRKFLIYPKWCNGLRGFQNTLGANCFLSIRNDNLCYTDVGAGIYCLDQCGQRTRQHVMGLVSFRRGPECSANFKIVEPERTLFSDFSRIGQNLTNMLKFCYELS